MKRVRWIILLVLLCAVPVQAAQTACPDIVQTALTVTNQVCAQTGRNQACYGNLNLQATPRDGVTDLVFAKAGDTADLTKIANLHLQPMQFASSEWGVALLRVQANLPDTLPGQNVTMLLFGNVEMTDAGSAPPPPPAATPTPVVLDVTSNNGSNVRAEPSTSAAIAGTLKKGETVKADGRSDAGDWLHIQLGDGTSGWVTSQLVTVSGDAGALPVMTSDAPAPEASANTPQYGPLQAFYFRSGAGDSPCAEAPDSGILIQTPEGAGEVNIRADNVDIQLGSTIYLQAQPGGEMTASVIEGAIWSQVQNDIVYAPAGTRVRVPLDANGNASGAPIGPEPYVDADLAALPLRVLPKSVKVTPALTADQIAALVDPLLPIPGQWTTDLINITGPEGCQVQMGQGHLELTLDNNGATLAFGAGRFDRIAPGRYGADYAAGSVSTKQIFQVLSPDQIDFHTITTYPSGAQCDFENMMNRVS